MQAKHVGFPVFITCSGTVLEWTFNNQTLPSDVTVSRSRDEIYIYIRRVEINHTGTYRCLIVEVTDDGEQKETWEVSALYVGG